MYDVYGIIGDPVSHSLSPIMHNLAFRELGLKAVYGAFMVKSAELEKAIEGIRALNIKGLSVTIPHKVTVMELLDEIDPVAMQIRAVNTIVNKQGRLYGTNTDWIGATKALEEQTRLVGKKILVVGAGGSSRAVCAGLVHQGAYVHIANRTETKAKDIAQTQGARV
jgi:shikimate dehydrogenase